MTGQAQPRNRSAATRNRSGCGERNHRLPLIGGEWGGLRLHHCNRGATAGTRSGDRSVGAAGDPTGAYVAAIRCEDYSNHRSLHRRVGDGWVCDTCEATA